MLGDTTNPAGVRKALEEIESDPAFVRAPVMRRLLRFLVEQSLAGNGDRLKSLTVAVEGLGRSDDFDSQTDSYPRVQVGRLRKMLDAYYEHAGSAANTRLHIPMGGYRVDIGAAASPATPPTGGGMSLRRLIAAPRDQQPLIAVLVLMAAILLVVSWTLADQRRDGNAWVVRDFPEILISPVVTANAASENRLAAESLRTGLGEMLSRFETVDVTYDDDGTPDYRLESAVRMLPADCQIRLTLIEQNSGRIVWSRILPAPRGADSEVDFQDFAARISGAMAQPWGIVHSDQRAKGLGPDTPYGCWQTFIPLWGGRHSADETAARSCVDSWSAADPASTLAQSMKAWLMVEDARRASAPDERRRLLVAGTRAADRAVELKPGSAVAHYARMYAAIHDNDTAKVREEAREILNLNGNNPALAAIAGIHLVYLGDRSGAPILDAAIARHAGPPHWLFTGQFFAAVLDDDPAAALRAARKFQTDRPTSLQKGLLAMALGRSGRHQEARRYWQQAVRMDPVLASNPPALLAPWPIAPDVQAKALLWLEPAIG